MFAKKKVLAAKHIFSFLVIDYSSLLPPLVRRILLASITGHARSRFSCVFGPVREHFLAHPHLTARYSNVDRTGFLGARKQAGNGTETMLHHQRQRHQDNS